ncbi:MAG: hypothetical protein HY712_01240 [candidate division NC10 bacterium]|nr:hypothetical protein [candidate division NC10 bacterium]
MSPPPYQRISLRIGPPCIALEGEFDGSRWPLDPAHHRFLESTPSPDLTVRLRYISLAGTRRWPVFRLGGLAGVYLNGRTWRFQVGGDDAEIRPDRAATLDASGAGGTLDLDIEQSPELQSVYPLQYPLEELLFRHLLADFGSVLLHACGISWQGRGYLFVGSSGAGKSTTAGLWKAAGGTMLNDDRTILEASPGGIRIHATPWFGQHPDVGGTATPLHAIFFLRQGPDVAFEPLRPVAAAALLFAKSFPPLWDPERLARTLEVLEAACRDVPSGWLMVPPDERAVEWVLAQG